MAETYRGLGLIERLAVVADELNGWSTIGRVAIWLGVFFLLVLILASIATSGLAIWFCAQQNAALLNNRQSHQTLEDSMRASDQIIQKSVENLRADIVRLRLEVIRVPQFEAESKNIESQFKGMSQTIDALKATQADILERMRKLEPTK